MVTFHIACHKNNLNIVKRVYEILESVKVDLTSIKNLSLYYALPSGDIDIIKYILNNPKIKFNRRI